MPQPDVSSLRLVLLDTPPRKHKLPTPALALVPRPLPSRSQALRSQGLSTAIASTTHAAS